jgi:energy-coupling factor transporter ATP-binding protein EcfA2
MNILELRVAGLRGFNDRQTIELGGQLVIYTGPNGAGKTSIGECLEWLLYGKTLKRSRGDEISKREYADSYKNAHYSASDNPFVEADVIDPSGAKRVVRRELIDGEGSVLTIDGTRASSLEELGIGTPYDRPLILQHTLQDFIFMKPKTRYEVLSAMLGLEPLIAFRNAVDQAKTNLNRSLPARIVEAQAYSATLGRSFQQEPLLRPVWLAIQQGDLKEAHKHLTQVALGRVAPGTTETDLRPALQSVKSSRERAQLDWGRFSLNPVPKPEAHQAISGLGVIDGLLEDFHQQLETAQAVAQPQSEEPSQPTVREFIKLGLQIHSSRDDKICPFCQEETLSPEKLDALRQTAEFVPAMRPSLAEAQGTLGRLQQAVRQHGEYVSFLSPALPSQEQEQVITALTSEVSGLTNSFKEAIGAIRTQVELVRSKRNALDDSIKTHSSLLAKPTGHNGFTDLTEAINQYADAVRTLPAVANGYAATYAALDPYVRQKLSSTQEVQFLVLLDNALGRWRDVELAHLADGMSQLLQDVVRQTRQFIEDKQREILGVRDKDIRRWYDMMNPGAQVGYDCIVPGTDSLELRARSFTRTMMAAPNLSASQLNCIGLSVYLACATRTASPHTMLLFDDPVQSMDDEHLEAFKKIVIKNLLDSGFQVIMLTHMDTFADDIEKLYRTTHNPNLFKLQSYSQSGPTVQYTGPQIQGLLQEAKKNMDSVNDGFRKQAIQALRQFVERFVKDLFIAETGTSVSKRFENKNWGELKPLLRQCKTFDAADESKLEDTHSFTSQFIHTDGTIPAKIASSAQIRPHYSEMDGLFTKYKSVFGIK